MGLRDRQAGVVGLELGKHLGSGFDGIGDRVERVGSASRRQSHPRTVDKRVPRSSNGLVDVVGAAGCHGAVRLMANGLGDLEGRTVGAVDVFSVDVVTND